MRQLVLDTETTGMEPAEGHRIIEIGCVELVNRRLSGRTFHRYLNPERDIDAAASQVHGITLEDVAEAPRFVEILQEFRDFVSGAELIIHNAPFDVGFLDHELALASAPERIEDLCSVLDTLALARRLYPGRQNSLDALCRRLMIDNSHRQLHGALLDAEILADVYLLMTGGQTSLSLGSGSQTHEEASPLRRVEAGRYRLPVTEPAREEQEAHEALLDSMEAAGVRPLWRQPRS